jgi:hypothetical protein
MNQEQQEKTTPTVPAEVAERLAQWRTMSRWAAIGRIWTGIFGITASVLATAMQSPYARYAAAVSTVCFGVSAFASFERVYFRYARAWRVLDAAILRFRYGNASLDFLLRAREKGETMIQELEEEQSKAEQGVGKVRPPARGA